jgi:hypothetical protein
MPLTLTKLPVAYGLVRAPRIGVAVGLSGKRLGTGGVGGAAVVNVLPRPLSS